MTPYLLSLLTGVAFSFVGLGYAIGGKRGVSPFYVGAFMFAGQALYFLPQAQWLSWHAGKAVYITAAISGAMSYLGFFLMETGIRRGLFSSVWIALNLTFVPQTLFCVLIYNEPASLSQWIGMGLATLSIIVLAGQKNKAPESRASDAAPTRLRDFLRISALLFGLLLCNSGWLLMMKILSYMPGSGSANLFDEGQSLFIALQALILLLLTGRRALLREPGIARFKAALPAGLSIATGSVTGMTLISLCVARLYSAAVCFPIYSVTGIVLVSLYSVLFFSEKPDRFWMAGNVLAVLCVLVLLF